MCPKVMGQQSETTVIKSSVVERTPVMVAIGRLWRWQHTRDTICSIMLRS